MGFFEDKKTKKRIEQLEQQIAFKKKQSDELSRRCKICLQRLEELKKSYPDDFRIDCALNGFELGGDDAIKHAIGLGEAGLKYEYINLFPSVRSNLKEVEETRAFMHSGCGLGVDQAKLALSILGCEQEIKKLKASLGS